MKRRIQRPKKKIPKTLIPENRKYNAFSRIMVAFRIKTRKGTGIEIEPTFDIRGNLWHKEFGEFIRLFAKPTYLQEIEFPQLKILNKRSLPEKIHLQKDNIKFQGIGYFGVNIVNEKQTKNPIVLISTIQHRKKFFELDNKSKKLFDGWEDSLLKELEETAKKTGIKKIAILQPKETERQFSGKKEFNLNENARRQFYIQLPLSHGYKRKIIELDTEKGNKKYRLWIKEI